MDEDKLLDLLGTLQRAIQDHDDCKCEDDMALWDIVHRALLLVPEELLAKAWARNG